jgi:Flp pilus assembly pilin Flp|tara:strand:- start:439 stop:1068 length:630 start_codon:yes stop_codon:yes gene_type:complete
MDSGTDQGGSGTVRGNGTVKFFNESKGFGFSVADQEGSGTLRNNDPIPGIDIIVEKDPEDNPALENSVAMLYYQFLLEGASDSEAIEYGLIAALMGDSDSEAIEYGLIAALMGETPEDQPVDLDDKIVRKKPGRVGDGADLDGGSGNNGSGTLRNNDPIPGIDVIVEKDPEENNSLDNSPVMMLNEMLNAGYSQAEVVEFALATGLIGQ